jgi:hypothetical protein
VTPGELTDRRGERVGEEPIYTTAKSLVLYKSFNSLRLTTIQQGKKALKHLSMDRREE